MQAELTTVAPEFRLKVDNGSVAPVMPLPGFCRKTLATGTEMMIIEWLMAPGARMPVHRHPHEQVGYLIRGDVTMIIGGKEHRLGPGDSYVVPSGVDHAGLVHTTSVMIDIFSPPREDYRR